MTNGFTKRIATTCFDAGYRACIEDLKDYNGPGLVTEEMVAYLEAIFKKAREYYERT